MQKLAPRMYIFVKFLFRNSVNDKSCKTCSEMCCNPVLFWKVNRTCFKLCFHNPEAFFNFPVPPVDFYYVWNIILKVGTDSIKTIVFGFTVDLILIKRCYCFFGYFTVCGTMFLVYKVFWIICIFLWKRWWIFNIFFCPFNLPFPYTAQVITVFDGVCNYQMLFNAVLVNPAVFVKYFVEIFFIIQFGNFIWYIFLVTGNVPSVITKTEIL